MYQSFCFFLLLRDKERKTQEEGERKGYLTLEKKILQDCYVIGKQTLLASGQPKGIITIQCATKIIFMRSKNEKINPNLENKYLAECKIIT